MGCYVGIAHIDSPYRHRKDDTESLGTVGREGGWCVLKAEGVGAGDSRHGTLWTLCPVREETSMAVEQKVTGLAFRFNSVTMAVWIRSFFFF